MKKCLLSMLTLCLTFVIALPTIGFLQPVIVNADFISEAEVTNISDVLQNSPARFRTVRYWEGDTIWASHASHGFDLNRNAATKWHAVDFLTGRTITRVVITLGGVTGTPSFRLDRYEYGASRAQDEWITFHPTTTVPGSGATRTFTVYLDQPVETSKFRVFLTNAAGVYVGYDQNRVRAFNDSPFVTAPQHFDIKTSAGVPPILPNWFNIPQQNGGRVLMPISWPYQGLGDRSLANSPGTYQVTGTWTAGGESGTVVANVTVRADANLAPMPVPYMGWNNWYHSMSSITQAGAMEQVEALINLGLHELGDWGHNQGYNLIWIDDFWWGARFNAGSNSYGDGNPNATRTGDQGPVRFRDINGDILTRHNFNYDFGQWVQWLHAQGLRAGIYTDTGAWGCGQGIGSGGNNWFENYRRDVQRFVDWGVDALKLDHCGGHNNKCEICQYNPPGNPTRRDVACICPGRHLGLDYNFDVYAAFYQAMQEIMGDNQTIILNMCEWGQDGPTEWAHKIANTWRTEYDLGSFLRRPDRDPWEGVLAAFDSNLAPAANRPNTVNDPDYIIFGYMGHGDPASLLTDFQTRSYFTMWAMMAAPLILSTDLTRLTRECFNFQTITNLDMISINQDPLVKQCYLVREDEPGLQVWAKPLYTETQGRQRYAVMLLNRNRVSGGIGFNWSDIGLENVETARIVWDYKYADVSGTDSYVTFLEAFEAYVLIVEGDKVNRTSGFPTNDFARGIEVEALANSASRPLGMAPARPNNAQRALDGRLNTAWQPLNRTLDDSYWWQVDLGQPRSFDRIVMNLDFARRIDTPPRPLLGETAPPPVQDSDFFDSRLEYFDGNDWQLLATISAAQKQRGDNVINFSYVTAQRLRWYISDADWSVQPRLISFSVFDSSNITNADFESLATAPNMGENIARHGNVLVTANSDRPTTHPASAVIDGNDNTRWNVAGGEINSWIMLDFGEPTETARMEIVTQYPDARFDNVDIQYSNNNVDWNTLAQIRRSPSGSQIEPASFMEIIYQPVTARYYRIHFTHPSDSPRQATVTHWRVFDKMPPPPVTYNVTFEGNIAADSIVVRNAMGVVMQPESPGVFRLERGLYTFTASRSNYADATGFFRVRNDNMVVPFEFTRILNRNLALQATASASSQWDANHAASRVNDGNIATRWNDRDWSADNPSWLALDFGAPTRTVGMEIYFGQFAARHARATIYWSNDNSNWNSLAVIALDPAPGEFQVERTTRISYPAVTARYYRIVFYEVVPYLGPTPAATLHEWRVFGSNTVKIFDDAGNEIVNNDTIPATGGLTLNTVFFNGRNESSQVIVFAAARNRNGRLVSISTEQIIIPVHSNGHANIILPLPEDRENIQNVRVIALERNYLAPLDEFFELTFSR
ncbi:MAG: discoidin domain-containing protein [Oscillospiraceae bacterium]|nr:discoidin domain-containing protein [Oscillospiraceae bacterium]